MADSGHVSFKLKITPYLDIRPLKRVDGSNGATQSVW